MLLDDDVLTGMIAELGESVPVPDGGAEAAVAALRRARPEVAPVLSFHEAKARRNRRIASVVGVAAAALIVLGVATSHGTSSSSTKSTASSAASAPGQGVPEAAASAAADAPVPDGLAQKLVPQAGSAASGSALSGLASPAVLPSAAAAGNSAPSATNAPVPSVDSDRVIRTGDVNLTVPKGQVPATVTRLQGASTGLGGFLQDSSLQQADPKSGGVPTASVTLRVPAAQFESLLTRVQALGTVVTSTTSGKDVTAQYVDLAARLKALETSRDTYLTILSNAKTVNDTLAVQQRLDGLQQQIEQLQGQQNELGAQSDLATLSVEVAEPAPVPAPAPAQPKARTGLAAAWHTAGDRFRRGSESVIAALGTIALLVIAGLAVLVAGRFGRRYYLRRTV